jgi:hypothetical protein
MTKENFTEQAYLYLMNELDESEKFEFEDILLQDDVLKNEFDEIKLSALAVQSFKPVEPDNRLLASARQSLMRTIRNEAAQVSPLAGLTNHIRKYLFENYRLAFGGIVTFALGIILGYILLMPKNPVTLNTETPLVSSNKVSVEDIEKGNTQISNVTLSDSNSKNGEVEVAFDAVKPVKVKGQATDPFIKKLLIASLLNESNPGLRLKSVNTISQRVSSESFKPDSKIKNALITAMKNDGNAAVRREALMTLTKYPVDKNITDALLYVLSNDNNSGMRVASINALADLKQRGELVNDAIRNVLNKKAENDNNTFVRIRAASILQEIQ